MPRNLTLVPPYPFLQTAEYPLRDVAFAHHGVWVEQLEPQDTHDYEWAIYYEPYQNSVYTHTMDAIFLEITFQNTPGQTSFLVSGYAVRPDEHRCELRLKQECGSYNEAKRLSLHWIAKAHQFIQVTAKRHVSGLH